MSHICVGELGQHWFKQWLVAFFRHQAIASTNSDVLSIGDVRTNFMEIRIEIHTFPFMKVHLKMSSGKMRQFCFGLNVLIKLVRRDFLSSKIKHQSECKMHHGSFTILLSCIMLYPYHSRRYFSFRLESKQGCPRTTEFTVCLLFKKTPSYRYRNPHYKPVTVWRPSQIYNGNPYISKTIPS